MMTWNHRVVHRVIQGDDFYGIHEVFYDDEGRPDMMTERAVGVCGDNLEELQQTLEWMLQAMDKPILEYDEIRGEEDGP